MALIDARKLIADPLVHFLVLGAGLFALYEAVSPEAAADGTDARQIEITAEDLQLMRDDWEKQWRRPPTSAEMDRLIAERLREEVLYREALEMGLDQGDPTVRRQMAEKILFMFQDLAPDEDPTDDQLNEYLVANAERYAQPAVISFRQVFFDPATRLSPVEDAARALAAVDGSGATPVGDAFELGNELTEVTEVQVARLLGKSFARQLLGIEHDRWTGPIESDYGLHLVKVTDYAPAAAAQLELVRDRVVADFLASRREALADEFYREALRRYRIEVARGDPVSVGNE